MSDLSDAWYEQYFKKETFLNATASARAVGYKHPNMAGPRNKKKYQEQIKERFEREVMSSGEALLRLSRMAKAPQSKCMTPQGPDMNAIVESGMSDMIKRYVRSATGSVTIEFHDQMEALKTILKVDDSKTPLNINLTVRGWDEAVEEIYGPGNRGNEEDTPEG